MNRNRTCDGCQKVYYRCNETKVWDQRNPGKRAGWRVTRVRLCMACESEAESRRMLMVVGMRITKQGSVRATRKLA